MTEGQSLFLILILLYLSDCLIWVPRQVVLFTTRKSKEYTFRLAGRIAGNLRGALVCLYPLPPFRAAFEANGFPFSIDETGVCAWASSALTSLGRPSQSGEVVLFEDIEEIANAGEEIYINGVPFVSCRTRRAAAQGTELIRLVLSAPPEKRTERLLEAFSARFDTNRIHSRVAKVHQTGRWIRPLSYMFFCMLLIIAPLICWRWSVNRILLPVALCLFSTTLLLILCYVNVHRLLYPEEPLERWLHGFIMVLSWPLAVRIPTDISRHALSEFDPFAIAHVILSDAMYHQLAGRIYRDLAYPLPAPELDDLQRRIDSRYRELLLQVFSTHSTKWGKSVMEYDLVEGLSLEEERYCPRCHTGYLDSAETCIECQGLPLRSVRPSSSEDSRHEQC